MRGGGCGTYFTLRLKFTAELVGVHLHELLRVDLVRVHRLLENLGNATVEIINN